MGKSDTDCMRLPIPESKHTCIRCSVCKQWHRIGDTTGLCLKCGNKRAICTICGKDICENCVLDTAWYGIIPYADSTEHPLCINCGLKLEQMHLNMIPFNQIPLHLNHQWLSAQGKELLYERLRVPPNRHL